MIGPFGSNRNHDHGDYEPKRDPFLRQLSRLAPEEFAAIQISSIYPAGTTLFLEHQNAHGVFFLNSGLVKLSVSSRKGKTLTLRMAGPGEIIGLTASMCGIPYETTAETFQSCRIAFVRQNDFARFAENNLEIYRIVFGQLASEYKSANAQLRMIGLSHSAPQKLARFLLHSSSTGTETSNGTLIRMSLTHEQIAECLGLSRETVTRTLSDFRNKRLIVLHGTTITIPSRAALEAIGGE